jgi:hypothetical protein
MVVVQQVRFSEFRCSDCHCCGLAHQLQHASLTPYDTWRVRRLGGKQYTM